MTDHIPGSTIARVTAADGATLELAGYASLILVGIGSIAVLASAFLEDVLRS